MQWTHEHYEQIKHLLPKQRDNVEIDNETFFEAMIHITENGFRWRAMPEKYGKWNTVRFGSTSFGVPVDEYIDVTARRSVTYLAVSK